MKLVIDISEGSYNTIKECYERGELLTTICMQIATGTPYEERPQGDCENCDFRKFSEKFVDGVVDLMNKNGITSVEQLDEILKGGEEE